MKEANNLGRAYNYPHVAAAYWVLYRMARNHQGLVTHHNWDWYLEHVYLREYANGIVRSFINTFKEYPPRQKPASFTIDQMLENLRQSLAK